MSLVLTGQLVVGGTMLAGLRVATIGPVGTGQIVFHGLERERVVPVVQVCAL